MGGLALYFAFVGAAVAGLWWLLNRLGLGQEFSLDRDTAERIYSKAYPDHVIADAREAHGVVLFSIASGGVGVVRAMGRFPVTLFLRESDVSAFVPGDGVLTVCLRDFAHPRLALVVDDAAALQDWMMACFRRDEHAIAGGA